MRYLVIISCLILTACATTPMEKRREDILNCVKDLKQNDSETLDAFEVCRQVYGLKKLKE